jgi:hypothetical protein
VVGAILPATGRVKQGDLGRWPPGQKARKPARKPAPAARPNPAPAKAAAGGGISLGDVEAVKGLVDKIGADKVEQLARVLGK